MKQTRFSRLDVMRRHVASKWVSSPLGVIVLVAVFVLIAEYAIMLGAHSVVPTWLHQPWTRGALGLLDALVVILAVMAAALFLVLRRSRAAERRFRSLVEQSHTAFCLVQDGRVVYLNPVMLEMLGHAPAAPVHDRAFAEVFIDDRHGALSAQLDALDAGNGEPGVRCNLAHASGRRVEASVCGTPTLHRGRPAAMLMVKEMTDQVRVEILKQKHLVEIEAAFMGTVQVATNLSEMRDPYTQGHARRVGEIAARIGAELGFNEDRQQGLQVAGSLHDIGKISVPLSILEKQEPLSPGDWAMIRKHPETGFAILKEIKLPWPVAEVAYQHHERLDGSGYPRGLRGHAILLESRIVMVADVVESMASRRPYRDERSTDEALQVITQGRGVLFDADVVDACLQVFQDSTSRSLLSDYGHE